MTESSAARPDQGLASLNALRRLAQEADTHSRALADETGLTLPQLLCLRAIHDTPTPPASVASVSQDVSLAASTVSGILDRLERAGLVRRRRDRRDRRQVNLTLTPTGRERLDGVPPLAERIHRSLQSLPDDERSRMAASLRLLLDELERGA